MSVKPTDINIASLSQYSMTNIESGLALKISFSGLISSDIENKYQEYA